MASVKLRRNATFAANLSVSVQKNSTANTATGGSWSDIGSTTITNANLPTGTTASDWVTATVSVTVPQDGTANGLRLLISESATGSTNGYFEVAQAQLEVGSVATQFTRAGGTLAGELAACQRYYYRQAPSAIYANFGWGNAETTGYFNVHFYLPVTMRTAPTSLETSAMNTFLYQTGGTSGTTPTTITMNANQTTANLALLQISKTTTFTVGAMYLLGANNTSTAYLGVSAEL